MAQHDQLYRRAVLYDIALQRDVSREAAFIPAVYERHTGSTLHSVLDIACGNAAIRTDLTLESLGRTPVSASTSHPARPVKVAPRIISMWVGLHMVTSMP